MPRASLLQTERCWFLPITPWPHLYGSQLTPLEANGCKREITQVAHVLVLDGLCMNALALLLLK